MIAILSKPEDPTAQEVMQHAVKEGIPVLWWNPLLPAVADLQNLPVRGILNRMTGLQYKSPAVILKKDRSYIQKEWTAAWLHILKKHPNCVNPSVSPYLGGEHWSFIKQFKTAEKAGFKVLKHRVIDEREESLRFANDMNGKIILRNEADNYRDFDKLSSSMKEFKRREGIFFLVEWPEGIPYFYHQVFEKQFFSRSFGEKQKAADLPGFLNKPIRKLIRNFGAPFVECLIFRRKNGDWTFGYISSFPELEHYRVHSAEIHKALVHGLAGDQADHSGKKSEGFIPFSLRPRLKARSI